MNVTLARRSVQLAMALVLPAILSACGGSSSGGGGTTPLGGEVITAARQSTPQNVQVGQSFNLLLATVTNNGNPAGNVAVTFTAPSSGASGTFVGGSTTYVTSTNQGGVAMATTFVANDIAGGPYNVTATASGISTPAIFVLTNNAGPAVSITATSGSGQQALVGAAFTNTLQATVLDSFSNPVSGATVTFTAPNVGASASFGASGNTATVTTGTNGIAVSPAVTAGTAVGSYTVTAAVSGVTSPANFTLTNNVGPGGAVTATSGSPQYAVTGAAFAKTLQASLNDQFGNPISGAQITFTANPVNGASGTFAGGSTTNSATTDVNGLATSTVFSANGTSGCYTISATSSGAASATFSMNNVQPALSATAGTTQTATVNQAFATDLQATVTGTAGACLPTPVPLPGVTVTFTAPSSGASGKFSDTSSATTTAVTNALGQANATAFTANGTAGSYSVSLAGAGLTNATAFSLTNASAATALAAGNYVFSVSGTDNTGSGVVYPYSMAGAFSIGSGASAGTITGGELDFTNYFYADHDQINGAASSISANADGNFVFTLVTCNGADCSGTDPNIGVGGILTLDASFFPQNSQKAFLTEFDASASGSGTLDFQTVTSFSTGGYAFGLHGLDTFGDPLAMGGVVSWNGQELLNASGSIFDANDDMTPFSLQTFSNGSVSGLDGFGRLEFTLDAADSTDFPEIILAGYTVDGNQIRLVETADSYLGELGGSALWQAGNTGNFDSTFVSGKSYVVGLNGSDATGTEQAVGLFTLGSSGNVTGFISYNDLSLHNGPSAITAGTYTIDGPGTGLDGGTGRVTLTGVSDGTATFNLQFYIDGNGNLTAAGMDTNDLLGGTGFQQGTGTFSSSSFNGAYAMSATGVDVNHLGEFDDVGPVTATGTGLTFSGSYDLNWLVNRANGFTTAEIPNESLSGTFVTGASGVFTGTIDGMDVTTCFIFQGHEAGCTTDAFDYYLIDTTGDSIMIETDGNQLTLGYFFQK
ncbi:MAG TPA: hypothetical protein VND65_20575 [Candidatus Binatia bacterium]|nr:hypothetical protein [Candidatus Binatia bacterium]